MNTDRNQIPGNRYDRNERFFGAQGQKKISHTKVAVVGLGGLGSHVAQQLAYLGTMHYALIDFDTATNTSLNRLIGSTEEDVKQKVKKTAVAQRTIFSILPDATAQIVDKPLAHKDAAAAIQASDVVFGCLDKDLHRLELNEITARHNKVYFDLASDIDPTAGTYGGRVVFCDGGGCIACFPDIIDQQAIARDKLSGEEYEKIYGVSKKLLDTRGPSVVSINGVVASLAITEFIVFVTGLRDPKAQLTYRGDQGTVNFSRDLPAEGCYFCEGLRKHEAVNTVATSN